MTTAVSVHMMCYESHLNVLIFFPPDWGMLRRSRCVQSYSFKSTYIYVHTMHHDTSSTVIMLRQFDQ